MQIRVIDDSKTRIFVTPEVKAKLDWLRKEVEPEVGALGLVKEIEEGYLIYDLFIPKQEAGYGSVDIQPEGIAEILNNYADNDVTKLRFYFHTHPGGVSPSSIDTGEFALFKDAKFFIWCIGSQSGGLNWGIMYGDLGIEISGVQAEVYVDGLEEKKEEWKKEYKENVKRPLPRMPVGPGQYSGGGTFNPYNPYHRTSTTSDPLPKIPSWWGKK